MRKYLPPVLLLAAIAAILCWQMMTPSLSSAERLRAARIALRAHRFAQAEELAAALIEDEDNAAAALIAGEAASRQERFADAMEYYQRAIDWTDEDRPRSQNLVYFAEAAVQIGQLSTAENAYRQAMSLDFENGLAQSRLEILLRTEGRLLESRELLKKRVDSNTADFDQVLNYGYPSRQRAFPDSLKDHMSTLRNDRLPLIAMAREEIVDGNTARAANDLRFVLERYPDCIDAQVALGSILIDEDESQFVNWYTDLPDACREHSAVWMLKGLFAERQALWDEEREDMRKLCRGNLRLLKRRLTWQSLWISLELRKRRPRVANDRQTSGRSNCCWMTCTTTSSLAKRWRRLFRCC
ncbi:MAG: tetratricopeptide repeat protein [Planctomycetaceae bacterium]